MERLKNHYGDKLAILAVSYQDHSIIDRYFRSTAGEKFSYTLSVVGDTMLHKTFPHYGIPYMIWIKDSKIYNKTDGEQVTSETVEAILSGDSTILQTVEQMTRERPLMLSENFDNQRDLSMISYSLFAKGRLRELGFGTGFHRSKDVIYGRQFTNLSLMEIFSAIAYEIFNQKKNPSAIKEL